QQILATGKLIANMQFLHNNDTVVMEFPNLPINTQLQGTGYTQAGSLNALKTGPGRQFIRAGGRLYVKMKAAGERWNAGDQITLTW
ncbi:MAG: hypothetical protein KTR33_14115, partial [Gammaproteobacteria bacterium]|nr:hypothetical protein [Gammaproteobacteria bacterium]